MLASSWQTDLYSTSRIWEFYFLVFAKAILKVLFSSAQEIDIHHKELEQQSLID